jgi:Zn-dependent alcohol dehydrogenase
VSIDPPGLGQIAVRIEARAICHSDIAYPAGAWGGPLPAVYGHEAAGRVTAVGPGVRGVEAGDRVLVTLIRVCGHCPACAGGAPTSCAHAWERAPSPLRDADGGGVAQGMNTGAFAEAVVVDASQVVGLPEDIAADLAGLLACGVITGVGAVVNTAGVRPVSSVAVVGAGGVGLNAVQGAAIAGAGTIIAVDVSEAKLEDARHFGATGALRAGPGAGAAIRDLTGGRGVDHAFVSVGLPSAIAEAAGYLGAGGALVIVGLPPSRSSVAFDPVTLASMNQRILGSRMGQSVIARDIPWLIEHWRAGRLKLAELVSGRFRLEEINDAIAATRSGTARRNVIVFGGTTA